MEEIIWTEHVWKLEHGEVKLGVHLKHDQEISKTVRGVIEASLLLSDVTLWNWIQALFPHRSLLHLAPCKTALTHWGGDKMAGIYFTEDAFKCIFSNGNVWISFTISMFVPYDPVDNIPTLVQIMAWCRLGDKPLTESMMVRLPTHICVTLPKRVR